MSERKDWPRLEWTAGYITVVLAILAFCFCASLVVGCERYRIEENARAGQTTNAPTLP